MIKVEKLTCELSGSVASSSKVVYPDTAQMVVHDPTKKSGIDFHFADL